MSLARARLLVVLIGLVLPYAVRLPFGLDWLAQYTDTGPRGWLLLGGVVGYVADRRLRHRRVA